MNKKKRKVAEKHRKADRKRPGGKPSQSTSMCFVGRIREEAYGMLCAAFRDSECGRRAKISYTKADAGFYRVTVTVKKEDLDMVLFSLKEGDLRHWGKMLRMVE